MTHPYQRLWTLDDYRRFLQHSEPLIRGWAADRIEAQYPHQMAESFLGLLTDPDSHLQNYCRPCYRRERRHPLRTGPVSRLSTEPGLCAELAHDCPGPAPLPGLAA